jgi:hypothetical protein
MRLLTLLVASFCFAFAASAQDSGLLVGLSTQNSARPYHTLWIPAGTTHPLDLDELILPRKDGFWRIGSYSTCAPGDNDLFTGTLANVVETEELWIVPVSTAPSLEGPLSCETALAPPATEKGAASTNEGQKNSGHAGLLDPCDSSTTTVTFVSQQYVSQIDKSAFECGIHPDGSTQFATRALDKDPELPLSAFFGAKADDAFVQAAKAELIAFSKKARDGEGCPPEKIDPTSWVIFHEQGRWKTRGWVTTNRTCGYGNEFALPYRPSENLTDHDITAQAWWYIAKDVFGAYDAVMSSDRSFALVLTGPHCSWNADDARCAQQQGDSIAHGYHFQSEYTAQETFRLSIQRDEQIVMIVSVQGQAGVARFTRELTALQSRGLLKPKIAAQN